jgi:guanylate kinase
MSSVFYLIVGPSGVGKGTVLRLLKKRRLDFFYPLSYTTRKPRKNEKKGETYFFISNEEFVKKIANEELLEYAYVHNKNYYGIIKDPVFKALDEGKTVIREVDYQGLLKIKKNLPKKYQMKSIFFMPPSEKILRERIKKRSPISEKELNQRMLSMKKELIFSKDCDYLLKTYNNNIEKTYQEFLKIIDD